MKWPKCEAHRLKPRANMVAKTNEKRRRQKALERVFGTCRPLPRRQTEDHDNGTTPATTKPTKPTQKRPIADVGKDEPVSHGKMRHPEEGHDNNSEQADSSFVSPKLSSTISQQAKGVQIDVGNVPKRPHESKHAHASACDDVPILRKPAHDEQREYLHDEPATESCLDKFPPQISSSAESSMNRRCDNASTYQVTGDELADTDIEFNDVPCPKRPRIQLTPGTILARRFPHLVKRQVPGTSTSSSSSNKRRRILNFQQVSKSDQCVGPDVDV